MSSLPVVGVTLDAEKAGGYSKMPWYALRENYCDSIWQAGGIPLPLPHIPEAAEAYLQQIDALVITGGAFDVDPALYGAATRHETVILKEKRTAFEVAVTKGALARNIPVLGICGGQQLLNVILGGTLIQHIPDAVAQALPHEQPNPRTEAGHEVQVRQGTLLHDVVGDSVISVNSAHHQAVEKAGRGVVVSGVAPDGIIEAIEHPEYKFCLGVQWHPEYHVSVADTKIFAAFIKAAIV